MNKNKKKKIKHITLIILVATFIISLFVVPVNADQIKEAEEKLKQAEITLEERKEKLSDAAKTLEKNKDGLNVDQTKHKLDELDGKIADNDKKYEKAIEEMEASKLASEEADKKIKLGSYGFFKEFGFTDAMNVLDNKSEWITAYTVIGNENDATSFENFSMAVDMISECNARRLNQQVDPLTGKKLEELRISPTMMAISEVQCNWSSVNYDHIAFSDIKDYRYIVGENLAWGYDDPFSGWIDYEEQIWNDAIEKAGGKENVFEKNPYLRSEVSHYFNCFNSNYEITGFAVNTTRSITSEQSFQFKSYVNDDMSCDDFIELLDEYYKGILSAHETYNNNIETVFQLKSEKDVYVNEYDELMRVYTLYLNLLKDYEEKKADVKAAQKEYNEAFLSYELLVDSEQTEINPQTSYGNSVFGRLISYGSATDTITIELYKSDSRAPSYTKTVTGNNTIYSIHDVVPGTYTMKVSKAYHCTREYTVTVDSEGTAQKVTILLRGDVTGDGVVNSRDLSRLYAHVNKTNLLTDYYLECSELTNDNNVNSRDLSRMYAHVAKTNLLFDDD